MRYALAGLVLLVACPSLQAQTNGPQVPLPSTAAGKAVQDDPEAAAVRARLEAFGYDNVTDLERDRAGLWHARALKDNEVISVIVDKGGRIIRQRR
jgi:hypothetical protein